MTKIVVGLFDSINEAQQVVQELVDIGFDRNQISLVSHNAGGELSNMRGGKEDATQGAVRGGVTGGVAGGVLGLLVGIGALTIPGIGPVLAAGPLAAALGSTALGAGVGAAAGGLIGGLVDLGVPDEDANYYAEGVRRGGTLVTVSAEDNRADVAYDIMQRYGAVDIDERGAEWRRSGWQRFEADVEPYSADQIETFRSAASATPRARARSEGETVLPVVEEEVQVGKRQIERGGIRVYTHVSERPVEEQVRLREERVNVERRPVDRQASEADINAFREGTFEVTETAEEAVVAKRARVVEEVVIDKDVQERTETVRDTVRRTDVDVEQVGAERSVGTSGFDTFDRDFRSNFDTNFANSGYTYEQFTPVYRYGYELASSRRYTGRDWSQVEADARNQWEQRNPGTWEQFKDAVRYAWDRARGAR